MASVVKPEGSVALPPPEQSKGGEFTPKLISVLREGYTLSLFRADALAGLTVAIVALPLSMALAIASGASPDAGLFTAIIGGFFISMLSGSRFQIGGPAGAFIVLVAAIIERRGFDGLALSTFLAGIFLIASGYLRLGSFIRLMPSTVITGFTAGVAVLIFSSQIRDFFGLILTTKEPSALFSRLAVLWAASPTINLATLFLGLASLLLMIWLRRYYPKWPGLLIGVAIATIIALLFKLPVETIGARFGGIASSLPAPYLPEITGASLISALPDALAIALLGGVESLLSAVVADGMSNRRHRSNAELIAQGVGSMASALFGGICVTGTLARTATNIRAGAKTPVAGMLHCVFLLGFMLLAAPLAALIPLTTLAAVLAMVCWNMIERDHIKTILHGPWQMALVLIVTFLITIFRDLIQGILLGCLLSALFSALDRGRAKPQ